MSVLLDSTPGGAPVLDCAVLRQRPGSWSGCVCILPQQNFLPGTVHLTHVHHAGKAPHFPFPNPEFKQKPVMH